ncbi:MAG: hypothetical protein DWH78_15325 [Planctomycetota bacterium]|nr:MAG: hypothetical protein DWH78_15325 [Planctomycetota bacterium]
MWPWPFLGSVIYGTQAVSQEVLLPLHRDALDEVCNRILTYTSIGRDALNVCTFIGSMMSNIWHSVWHGCLIGRGHCC